MYKAINEVGFVVDDILNSMNRFLDGALAQADVLFVSPWESPTSAAQLWHVMIACESHRQMLATALGVLAGDIEHFRSELTGQLADEMMPRSRGVVLA